MKRKFNNKNIIAIIFVGFIVICGILTFTLNPTRIFGGLVRGYLDAPEESNVLQRAGSAFKSFEGRMSQYFAFHDASIHAYGGVQRLLGRNLIDDTDKSSMVLKLDNGYLTFKQNTDIDLTSLKDYLIKLKATCDASNSELLYVHKASKDTTDETLLPDFYPYAHSLNFNKIKPKLENNGINILDLQTVIKEQNLNKYSLFFKTDHHWTPKTGIWVSQNIVNKLNQTLNWNLDTDVFNIENFNIKTYEQCFLGSQGKRIGALYSGLDDFDVITPKFETDYVVEMRDTSTKVSGDFAKTMLFEDAITPDNILNKDNTAYATYLGGNHDFIRMTNNKVKNGKKAVLILDSFGCVVAPYLSLPFEQLDCIDIRGNSLSVEDYIKENSPDAVIYMIIQHQ